MRIMSGMSDMREILQKLMKQHEDTATSLARKSGVPQPTIYRFIKGQHSDPRSAIVKKLAAAYGLTESQLRGNAPLPGENKGRGQQIEMDEFKRQLLMFYSGMSPKHKDLLVMVANRLYSIDNPKDKTAMPFPTKAELRDEAWIPGMSQDRRKP